jgi:hypothetical protein
MMASWSADSGWLHWLVLLWRWLVWLLAMWILLLLLLLPIIIIIIIIIMLLLLLLLLLPVSIVVIMLLLLCWISSNIGANSIDTLWFAAGLLKCTVKSNKSM